jgi:PPOX class probable F420-dependent enzyme
MPDTLDPATDDGARALRRLESELMAWLTTVNPDGQPQSSPIWFLWDGGEILLYSWFRAPRNANVADRPLVSFSLESGVDGEDVVTAEGEARIVQDEPPASANPTYLAKYQRMFDAYGWTLAPGLGGFRAAAR